MSAERPQVPDELVKVIPLALASTTMITTGARALAENGTAPKVVGAALILSSLVVDVVIYRSTRRLRASRRGK